MITPSWLATTKLPSERRQERGWILVGKACNFFLKKVRKAGQKKKWE
jgi:hypothetical protein